MKTLITLIKNNKLFSSMCGLSIINTCIYFKYPTTFGVHIASFLTGGILGYLWYYRKEIMKIVIKRG
jgi:hypothetical protein